MSQKTAKLFMNGRSQAVRLPKEFRFEGKEVYVHREGNQVVLSPKVTPTPPAHWQDLLESASSPSQHLTEITINADSRPTPTQKRMN